ncbi:MAG TPA: hypothetical protein PKD16_19675, partial [Saprospiraceae bacterium]|nr:hypothetical protein [Saprospiraceae bacterium]HMT72394.1 hypothetical protein [Saprospiraceae bacterium]
LRRRIVCLNKNGKILWVSNTKYGVNTTLTYGSSLGLADFNHDNIPEIYILNEIFNAMTGIRLCEGKNNNIGIAGSHLLTGIEGFPIALNVDDEPSLELVAGSSVYKIDILNLNGEIGNSMMPLNLTINGVVNDGMIGFIDIDGDGVLEICLSSGKTAMEKGLFIYKIENKIPKLISTFDASKINQIWYTGPLITSIVNGEKMIYTNIGDEIIGCNDTGNGIINILQNKKIIDKSVFTSFTIFDLNHDGLLEIIHRDEELLRIFTIEKNNNLTENFSFPCKSFTYSEMPIVTALEKNGEARICVTCMDSNNQGRLTIFGPPPGQRWAPARKIWHQYAYNPLFINDDGTVPQYMHN